MWIYWVSYGVHWSDYGQQGFWLFRQFTPSLTVINMVCDSLCRRLVRNRFPPSEMQPCLSIMGLQLNHVSVVKGAPERQSSLQFWHIEVWIMYVLRVTMVFVPNNRYKKSVSSDWWVSETGDQGCLVTSPHMTLKAGACHHTQHLATITYLQNREISMSHPSTDTKSRSRSPQTNIFFSDIASFRLQPIQ